MINEKIQGKNCNNFKIQTKVAPVFDVINEAWSFAKMRFQAPEKKHAAGELTASALANIRIDPFRTTDTNVSVRARSGVIKDMQAKLKGVGKRLALAEFGDFKI